MHILFYATSSAAFEPEKYKITQYPSCLDNWTKICRQYPAHKFTVVTQLPAAFIADYDGNTILKNTEGPDFILMDQIATVEDAVTVIRQQKPDIAVSLSFWVNPYDWLNIKDSLIAQKLRNDGIKTICHSTDTCLKCFNKWETHMLLESKGFNVAKAVFVNHSLYFNADSKKEILENVYKKAVLNQIANMNYPLIIKDTFGLSSVGMDVVNTYDEAVKYLESKKNCSDRIVEEYIAGTQAGVEIYGSKGNYTITPPLVFSVNKYGITSPKQSVKFGPIEDSKYNGTELTETLAHLADVLDLEGIAQVDLVYSNNKWYIIEVNPRLSGMTLTYSALYDTSPYNLVLDKILKTKSDSQNQTSNQPQCKVLNIKFPILSQSNMEKLKYSEGVRYIRQIDNLGAKQERERGFCEVILVSKLGTEDLIKKLDNLKDKFSDCMEMSFYDKAVQLIQSNL